MDIAAVSRLELAERRRRLRRQRRLRILRASWRSLAVLSFAGGLVWVISLPVWVIHHPQQVDIEGNKLLSTKAIQAILPIDYPQALWQIQPEAIAEQLKQQAPISEAMITRRLLPPGLVVQIRERAPVAIAVSNSAVNATDQSQIGLLDKDGTWMPLESYTSLNQSSQLPKLKVIGMQEQYRSQWVTLYQTLSTSPVKILEVDWRQPANLTLKTELGVVYCGFYGDRFAEQLEALDRMRQLPKSINANQISHIDLTNPDSPLVEMVQVINRIDSPP
jgi:cell division protein FtsQ